MVYTKCIVYIVYTKCIHGAQVVNKWYIYRVYMVYILCINGQQKKKEVVDNALVVLEIAIEILIKKQDIKKKKRKKIISI